jgi:signal transduction histidine kinase
MKRGNISKLQDGGEVGHAGWLARRGLWFQFSVATSSVLAAGMLSLGYWVTQRISEGVIHNAGVVAANYAENFISERVQELSRQSSLEPESKAALDALLKNPEAPLIGFRIWKGDTIVYSDRRELIGQTFAPSSMRDRAWSGQVAAEYGYPHGVEDPPVGEVKGALLEIYAPVYKAGAGEIIALAETYQRAPGLAEELAGARRGSWMLVGLFTLIMLTLQSGIVRRASRTIDTQRRTLREKIEELSRLLEDNHRLQLRASQANRRVAETNERFLRKIGSELHDGPVQLLSMAVFRLDALEATLKETNKELADETHEDSGAVREALRETLAEIRSISAGLAPPEIERLSLQGALELAARRHERRSGTPVNSRIGELPERVPFSLKTCLYRVVQEGLTNAFRHANGRGQILQARYDQGRIEVSILDAGPGLDKDKAFSEDAGQGLVGLRDRVQSLGGEFHASSRPKGGTCLTAAFEFAEANMEAPAIDA